VILSAYPEHDEWLAKLNSFKLQDHRQPTSFRWLAPTWSRHARTIATSANSLTWASITVFRCQGIDTTTALEVDGGYPRQTSRRSDVDHSSIDRCVTACLQLLLKPQVPWLRLCPLATFYSCSFVLSVLFCLYSSFVFNMAPSAVVKRRFQNSLDMIAARSMRTVDRSVQSGTGNAWCIMDSPTLGKMSSTPVRSDMSLRLEESTMATGSRIVSHFTCTAW
jgi:hypothetical protein